MISDALPSGYNVFVDLSDTPMDAEATARHLRLLEVQCGFAQSDDSLVALAPRGVPAHGALAAHVGDAPGATWSRAVAHATSRRRHLVVILGRVLPGNEVIQPLLDALGLDPLFGSAQPRFADAATDGVWPLPPAGPDANGGLTSRAALARLPPSLITAELLAAVTVIRREVVAAIVPAHDFMSLRGAVAHSLCQARRRGFRNVVANRVIVASELPSGDLYPALSADDAAQLLAQYPDTSRAATENERLAQRRLEPLLNAAHPKAGLRRRLLLNCRGLTMLHNGTSKCVLGMLDGFAALDAPWQIDIVASAAAMEFHGMASRYPQFDRLTDAVPGHYAAALMLNQPWAAETVAEMHRYAFLIGFNILDTIGWDILFPAPERLEWAWRLVARHSDILTYISAFSQDRFRRRFPVAPCVTERVVHLTFLASEHTLKRFQAMPEGEHVLLFGNDYDHKGIAPAIRLLREAFPLQEFAVVGGGGPPVPGVRLIPSGETPEDEVHRLVATARAVVYPSFYEGFGLPVVESLAYGRPVLVRSCPLWHEIAAHSRLPGRLIEFDDPASLVEALGQVLAGSAPPGLPFGTALGEAQTPTGWRDAAAAVLQCMEDRLAHAGIEHWRGRDEALRTANL